MIGSYGDDSLKVTDGAIHCGYELDAVDFAIPSRNKINMRGDDGNDFMWVLSNGANAYMLGQLGDDVMYSERGDVYIDGDIGNDEIGVKGNGENAGFYWGGEGDDWLFLSGALSEFNLMGCGGGAGDWWCGSGTRPDDCEATVCP
jgi:hypothetical protein